MKNNNLFEIFVSKQFNQKLIDMLPEDKKTEILEGIKNLFSFIEENNIISENKTEK